MLLITSSLAAAPSWNARVHDWDSIRLCSGERVRIANIDAPELFGSERCSARKERELAETRNPARCDFDKGERAREALAAFVLSGTIRLQRVGTDHYGRTLARISAGGRDAGEYLMQRGLARRWR